MASRLIPWPSLVSSQLPIYSHRSSFLSKDKTNLYFNNKQQFLVKLSTDVAPFFRGKSYKVLNQQPPCCSITPIQDPYIENGLHDASGESVNDYVHEKNVNEDDEHMFPGQSVNGSDPNWLLKVLVLTVVLAAGVTIFSVLQPQANGALGNLGPGFQYQLKLFGRELQIRDNCPGYVYFWLLMAAGFGLFVSEEALNVWVGGTIARTLVLNGIWTEFVNSVSLNAVNIFSTLFWVYWGVCISDMVPFYAGRFAARTNAGDALRKQSGVSKKKLADIMKIVQRYGNLIGFVERFSIGMRNPTSFLAGAMGVSPSKYFTGVCLGALITVPLQFAVGFLLRERPVTALAMVAAIVGAWSVLPYIAAGITSIVFIFFKKREL